MDPVNVSEDRDMSRAFVNTITNLLVSQNVENFLST